MALLARYDHSGAGAGCGIDDGAVAPEGVVAPASRPKCSRCEVLAHARVRGDFLCKACLMSAVYKRCRLPATAPPLQSSDVLVAWSGGEASRVLVDMAAGIMHCGRKKRWWRDAATVHVDTSGLASLWRVTGPGADAAAAAARRSTASVIATSIAAGLHCYVVPLEAAFAPALHVVPVSAPAIPAGTPVRDDAPSPLALVAAEVAAAAGEAAVAALGQWRAAGGALHAASAAMNAAFEGAAGLDTKQDLLEVLTRRLCAEVGAAAGLQHVVLGSCLDRIAQTVITALCSGAGYAVPLEVAAVDSRWEGGFTPMRPAVQPAASAAPDSETASASASAVAASAAAGLAPFQRLRSNWYPAAVQEGKGGASPYPPLPSATDAATAASSAASSAAAASSAIGVRLVRPLLDIERKELVLYCTYKGLHLLDVSMRTSDVSGSGGSGSGEALFLPSYTTAAPARSAISRSTLQVLAGLQAAYPATVHNVVRTARKLTAATEEAAEAADGAAAAAAAPSAQAASAATAATVTDAVPVKAVCRVCAAPLPPSHTGTAGCTCYPCSRLLEAAPLFEVAFGPAAAPR